MPKEDTQFKKGHPGGPGRPKGKTIKEMVKDWLETHPEDMQSFVEHFVKNNKELAWQMLEGKPHQSGDMEVTVPQTLIDLIKGDGLADKTGGAEVPAEDTK